MEIHDFVRRGIYHNVPPAYQSRDQVNPTLLVSWWCTIFALTTILIRIIGRWVRTERLFREDKIMFYSIIPLMIRMGLVHVILIYGTNNTTTDTLTPQEILRRETGSKLVLVARIFYAAFIWIAKLTVLEFLKRTIGASWAKSYELGLRLIYGFLLVTFIAIIVGTLTECHPFGNYWQVVPDPGPQCREGLVQLIIMGVCDIVTDVVLIVFPIPVVLRSQMPFRKKCSLILLFLLSAILIAITAYRIPSTIQRQADQPYRSLLASLEILAAAGVSNAVIIGSFIRDKGVKKAKFRAASIEDSANGNSLHRTATGRSRSITMNHWGSDEDLVRDLGVALPPILRHATHKSARAATAAPHYQPAPEPNRRKSEFNENWNFRRASRSRPRRGSASSVSTSSTDIKLQELHDRFEEPVSPGASIDAEPLSKQMSFFDVGGLVDGPKTELHSHRHSSKESDQPTTAKVSSPTRGRSGSKQFLSDIGGLLSRHKEEDENAPAGTTSRSLTPMRAIERRKVSRSPRPSKVLDRATDSSSRQDHGKSTKNTGPDSLDFGDVGGLLR